MEALAVRTAKRMGVKGALLTSIAAYSAVNTCRFLVHVYRAWILNKIPGPSSNSLLWGQFWNIRELESHVYLGKWRQVYGDVCCYRVILFGYRVMLSSVEDMKRVLISQPKRYPKPQVEMKFVRTLAGDGLVCAEGATHTRQRKIVAEAFHFDAVSKLYPIFVEEAQALVKAWAKVISADSAEGKKTVLDCGTQMSYVTLDIIGLTAFGYSFDCVKGSNSEVRNAYMDIMPLGGLNIVPALLKLLPFLNLFPIPAFVRARRAQDVLRTLVRRIVDSRVKRLSEVSEQDFEKHDLLDVMLKAGRKAPGAARLTNEELANNVRTFLLAGHETTSTALTWTHYLLALNPHVRDKLCKELKEKLNGRAPTFRELSDNEIPYLNAISKEVMRLYPPVPLTIRVTTEDDEFGGYKVPRNTILILSPGALGRSPDLWDRPDEFVPERWFTADGQLLQGNEKHAFAWMPFLAGERSCIGRGFAEKEYMCLLAIMVQHVQLDIAPECPPIRSKSAITQFPFPKLLMTASLVNPAAHELR
eukprot:Tamp_11433.p1 GENE.Tamp_11433~~Tamp_11433.p1  ORF type:complete len:556 (+),score=77.74 Tamp_11433:79-1668(+)